MERIAGGKGSYARYFAATKEASPLMLDVTQPGLRVRVTQPYSNTRRALQPWLELAIDMSQLPALPLRGVMGGTFLLVNRDSWQK